MMEQTIPLLIDAREGRAISARDGKVSIPDRLLFRIGDVSDLLGVKSYVLRYWEKEFPVLSPHKSNSGQRVYKRSDVEMLVLIKHLLYSERYSIEGARKKIIELRKKGSLKTFQVEKGLGRTLTPEQESQKKQISRLAEELMHLSQSSVREIFKY